MIKPSCTAVVTLRKRKKRRVFGRPDPVMGMGDGEMRWMGDIYRPDSNVG